MGERSRWSGNLTTNLSICDDELDHLAAFISAHDSNYIFGAGKVGSGLAQYLKQAKLHFIKNITSEDIPNLKKDYKEGRIGIIIGVGDGLFEEILSLLREFLADRDLFILSSEKREDMGERFTVEYVTKNFWINIFVTNKCNLLCKSCSTYAPICKSADDYDLDAFKMDIKKLKDLNLPTIKFFNFTGGEPLLHPDLTEILSVAREAFPEKNMNCFTNGLKLQTVSDDYLIRFRELNISLTITEYPLDDLEFREIYKRLDDLKIKYNVIFSEGQKYFSKRPLKLDKSTKPYLYYYCPRYRTYTESLFLFKGTLSKCIYSFAGKWFNEAFDTHLERVRKDYINLYNTTPDEVYSYCIQRLPYCGYCSPIEELVPWELSKQKIEEWT